MKRYLNLLILSLFILTPNLGNSEQIKEGFGKAQLPDSSVYQGNFKNGMFDGKGALIWTNGSKYEGEFKDGLMNGKGVFTQRNGDKYEGDFKDGYMDGKGIFIYGEGTKYEGEFKDGYPNGKGSLIRLNGEKYEGDFVNGKLEGLGTYISPNGARYEGEVKNNLAEGRGTLIYVNGDKYEGKFKNGLPNGKGILFRSNGEKDEGEFKNGNLSGTVKITDTAGVIFEGECNNGLEYCKGVIIRKDGSREEYEVKGGKFYPLGQKQSSTDSNFTIPKEIDSVIRSSNQALSKTNFFKVSESQCLNEKCINKHIEINRLEKKAYVKLEQGADTLEAYVIDGVTYQKVSSPDINNKNWRKTKAVMPEIEYYLDPNSKQDTLAQCINSCPYYKPKGMVLEQGKKDGHECYVVNILYPDKTSQNLLFKTTSKIFYDKNSYLPYGSEMNAEGSLAKSSAQLKYYDYNIHLEIKLPPEAVNAIEVSPDEIKSLK
ncbi:MAG: hypothetical protein PHT41_02290 [Candidatus Omnitrophica bacterium]|nr:hypothetical protein [Candidatus Omnitrophota bacterium]